MSTVYAPSLVPCLRCGLSPSNRYILAVGQHMTSSPVSFLGWLLRQLGSIASLLLAVYGIHLWIHVPAYRHQTEFPAMNVPMPAVMAPEKQHTLTCRWFPSLSHPAAQALLQMSRFPTSWHYRAGPIRVPTPAVLSEKNRRPSSHLRSSTWCQCTPPVGGSFRPDSRFQARCGHMDGRDCPRFLNPAPSALRCTLFHGLT